MNLFSIKIWRKSNNLEIPNAPSDAITSIPDIRDQSYDTKKDESITLNDEGNPEKGQDKKSLIMPTATSDSVTMPPPPINRKKLPPVSSFVTNPSERNTLHSQVPNFTIVDYGQENRDQFAPPTPPVNPALRTSAGIQGPVQFMHVTEDSRSQGIASGSILLPKAGTSIHSSMLSNRKPTSLASTVSQSTSTKRNLKVILKPGHSPLDWARLSNSKTNLSGLPPGISYLKVQPSLLKTQTGRKGKNAWTVLSGRVYNITPYLSFHPGGESELLRCAGRDGTKLFNEIHPWVNWEGMLSACLVGIAVEEGEVSNDYKMDEMD